MPVLTIISKGTELLNLINKKNKKNFTISHFHDLFSLYQIQRRYANMRNEGLDQVDSSLEATSVIESMSESKPERRFRSSYTRCLAGQIDHCKGLILRQASAHRPGFMHEHALVPLALSRTRRYFQASIRRNGCRLKGRKPAWISLT